MEQLSNLLSYSITSHVLIKTLVKVKFVRVVMATAEY